MDIDIFGFFQPVIDVFDFIVSILSTIVEGITGITLIIKNLISLLLSITRILPDPLYPCLFVFLSIYSTIFIFKIVRKG